MKNSTLRQTFALSMMVASCLFIASNANASGSMPSTPRAPASGNSQSTTSNSYELGKAVYMEKISCSSCPVAEGVNDAAGAKNIIMRVDANEFKLTKTEKRRLKAFLNRRFELK